MSKSGHSKVCTSNNDADIMPELDDVSSEDSWSDEETSSAFTDPSQHVKCLFSEKLYLSAKEYFVFLKDNCNFDIWKLVHSDLSLDFFGYVKLINFLRSKYVGHSPPTPKELIETRDSWDTEEYLKPVVCDDALLQFIIDDGDDEDFDCELFSGDGFVPEKEIISTTMMTDKDVDIELLKSRLANSESKNRQLSLHLKEATARIQEMKEFMKDVILKGDIYRPVAACRRQEEEEEEFEDSGYFGTYAHHDIHAEMLQDKVRTLSYRDAILSNPDCFKEKIVLDVGCGTGILSMFAAQAGAKHVYAVDMSDIAYQAMEIIRENKLQDKITVIKGCIEEVQLPVKKVDIIISEWMGYFLLYESMLDSVLFARDKWLAPKGLVLPDNCNIQLVAAHDEDLFEAQVDFWKDVYGFQMSCIKKASVSEASIQVVKPSSILSDSASVLEFSISGITMKDLNYKSPFILNITKSGKCSAIVGYFDIYFKEGLSNVVFFSTGPCTTPTHWKQTIFFLEKTIDVCKGDRIAGYINCHKNPKDPRSLMVELTIADNKQTYSVS